MNPKCIKHRVEKKVMDTAADMKTKDDTAKSKIKLNGPYLLNPFSNAAASYVTL